MPWTAALAAILRAAVSSVALDRDATLDALRASVRLAQNADMQLYAAAARYQLGRLLGGIEGEGILERAEDAMVVQEIRAPARFAGMLVPVRAASGALPSERAERAERQRTRSKGTTGGAAPVASTAARR